MPTRKNLIKNLHDIQKWRRGKGKTMPLSPKEFGEAIDDCIRILRCMSDKDYECFKDRRFLKSKLDKYAES